MPAGASADRGRLNTGPPALLGLDGSAVGLDEPAGRRKPKPDSPVAAGTAGVGAAGDSLQVIGGNSRPGVGHLYLNGIASPWQDGA